MPAPAAFGTSATGVRQDAPAAPGASAERLPVETASQPSTGQVLSRTPRTDSDPMAPSLSRAFRATAESVTSFQRSPVVPRRMTGPALVASAAVPEEPVGDGFGAGPVDVSVAGIVAPAAVPPPVPGPEGVTGTGATTAVAAEAGSAPSGTTSRAAGTARTANRGAARRIRHGHHGIGPG